MVESLLLFWCASLTVALIAMAKLASGDGACTEADLQSMGFTKTEISTWRDDALRVARRMGGEA